MIHYSMDVVNRTVEILNPGQTPIITTDQPLYTVAKEIRSSWPETHGEYHFIVMLCGLHVEMAALTTFGDLLERSSWLQVRLPGLYGRPGSLGR